jgi:S-adenosylmethionine synthetase
MIVIEPFRGKSVSEHKVEIVERKGTGHPDTICDSIMDAISVALCDTYIKKFGTILHHNIDKGLLAAGRTEKRFGGGRILKPMELIIGDRATFRVGKKKIPLKDIAVDTAKKWIKKNLRFVDPVKSMKYRMVLSEGSEELTDIFSRNSKTRGANDTSAAVGYFPLSPLEQVVLNIERHLNSKDFKKRFPETGEDIKVMGVRRGRDVDLTVAMPLLSPYVFSEEEYFYRKGRIYDEMMTFIKRYRNRNFRNMSTHYNTLDEKGRGIGGVYLSLQGTSAEDADSGEVGRGNRVNGLISINRPMGTEAAAGKNPVSHVGKIYNILSHKTAQKIHKAAEGIKEVYVLLLSRIGEPIDRPQMANVQMILERGAMSGIAEEILKKELKNINKLCIELAKGKYPVC